jgi:predicted ArsR family transcriptional regulator
MKKQVMTGRINRNRIIETLVRQYPDSITTKQVASQMRMSHEGVGLHLKQLEKDGYVIKEWGASEAGAGRCLHWRLRSLDIKILETKEEEEEPKIKTMTKSVFDFYREAK